MDKIFFDSKLNLRQNSGRPNERIHVTMWWQIAYTLRQKSYFIQNLFEKKIALRFISACRKHLVYFLRAFLTTTILIFDWKKTVLTTTVRKTEVPAENSDGAGRQCMRGKWIPHHGAGDVMQLRNSTTPNFFDGRRRRRTSKVRLPLRLSSDWRETSATRVSKDLQILIFSTL